MARLDRSNCNVEASADAAEVLNTRRLGAMLTMYCAALAVIYASTLTVPYAFTDTYVTLTQAFQHHLWGTQNAMLQGGRPLYALVTTLAFLHVHSLAGLHWIRLVGLLGLGAFAAAFGVLLGKYDLPRTVIWTLPLITACMPPFQVYIAWAMCAPYAWAAFFAGVAFLTLEQDLRLPLRLSIAVIVLAIAISLYQPAAMIFWVFTAVAWLAGRRSPALSSVVIGAAVMLVALAIDFALAKTLSGLILGVHNNLARAHVDARILSKLAWFVRAPLRQAANLSRIVPSTAFALAILAWVITGLGLYWRHERAIVITWRAILAVALVPLCYLPNLIVAENWPSYRTQVALTALILLYATLALLGWLQLLRQRRLLRIVAVLVLGVTSFMAANNVTREFAVPQREEWMLVKRALKRPAAAHAKHIYFTLSTVQDRLAPVARWDEFGVPSTSKPWVPVFMVKVMGRNDGIRAASAVGKNAVLTGNGRNHKHLPAGSCVIDLGQVLAGTGGVCTSPGS